MMPNNQPQLDWFQDFNPVLIFFFFTFHKERFKLLAGKESKARTLNGLSSPIGWIESLNLSLIFFRNYFSPFSQFYLIEDIFLVIIDFT